MHIYAMGKYLYTRIFRRYAPLILAPAGGTWCLRRVHGPSGHYPVGLGRMKTSNIVSHGHIKGGLFFFFFRSDVCSQSYEVKHASSFTLLAAARTCMAAEV